MRKSTIVMVAFAVVFGLLAVFIAQAWLKGQAERRLRSLEAQKKPDADEARRTFERAWTGADVTLGPDLHGASR